MSFIFKTLDVESQYKKVLTAQKNLIKNNKYVRELEEKYHKSNRKIVKPDMKKTIEKNPKAHFWPVDSQMFTKVLKSRLNMVFTKIPLESEKSAKKIMQRPRTNHRYSMNQEKKDENMSFHVSLSKKKSAQLQSRYQKKRFKSSSNISPLCRAFTRRAGDSIFNESMEDLVRLPRYN